MAKKPSGITGAFSVTVTEGGELTGHHDKVNWPSSQKDIERKILGFFMREFEKSDAKFIKIEDGGTEELDFLLTLPGGKVYLELMEAVVPRPKEIPFQSGNRRFEPITYADVVFHEITKKIAKYGLKHEIPIDLLIYLTHEQYNPNNAAINVLRRYLIETEHPFQYVFFLIPHTEDFAVIHVLFNRECPFDPPALAELAESSWVNVVSSEGKIEHQ